MQRNSNIHATGARIPVWRTVTDSYRFLAAHPRDMLRVGWLPLIALFGFNVLLGTFEPRPELDDPTVALSQIGPLLGIVVVNVLVQSAIAAMTLVIWHRFVMQGFDIKGPAARLRLGAGELKYLARWMLISLLFLLIMFTADLLIVVTAMLGMLSVQAIAFFSTQGQGAGMELGVQGEQLSLIGKFGLLPAAMIAIYFTTRLSLVLPATATGKTAGFARAWQVSEGNGLRMVLASLIAMTPVQLVMMGLTEATGYMFGSLLYYPLALAASAAFLLFILATGTVLSLFSLGLDRVPEREEAEEEAAATTA